MATGIRRLFDPAGADEHGNPIAETVRERILRHTRRGLPPEIAAQSARISTRTFTLWLQAGRSAISEIDTDPQVELSDEQRIAAEFATDIDASLGSWLAEANVMLEAETRRQRIVSTKEVHAVDANGRVVLDANGVPVVAERTVTTKEVPGELGRLAWRMGKVSPVYGRERIELTGADGGPVEVDIGERLATVLADIRAAISTDPARVNGNGIDHETEV